MAGSVSFGMLHHVSLGTSDLDRARAFYDPVMHELGLRRTLAYGAIGHRAPGLRPEYDAHSYAAFVHDPDGN